MNNIPSIVLTSGGMDSLVTLAIAHAESTPAALHATYGQRTADRERSAFRELVAHYEISQSLECDLGHLRRIGGSSLTDHSRQVRTGGVDRAEIPSTYVPFRNAHLLATAVSWAETIGAKAIYIGAVEEDSSGYPDCREDFCRAFERAARLGSARATDIEIRTPLIHATKPDIVRRGLELEVPFNLSWSCYTNEDYACGKCDSCRLRLEAFRLCGAIDPIPYQSGS